MGLDLLLLVDSSGLAITRYPTQSNTEENFQLFSALLTSLSKSTKDLGFGELKYLVIGKKKYIIKEVGENFLIAVFDEDEDIESWFFDLIHNSIKSVLNYARDEEGLIKDYEANLFRNVLKNFYQKYNELKEQYDLFKKTLEEIYKQKGEEVLEVANTISLPELEIWEEGNNIIIKNIRTGDIQRFKEILEKAISVIKET